MCIWLLYFWHVISFRQYDICSLSVYVLLLVRFWPLLMSQVLDQFLKLPLLLHFWHNLKCRLYPPTGLFSQTMWLFFRLIFHLGFSASAAKSKRQEALCKPVIRPLSMCSYLFHMTWCVLSGGINKAWHRYASREWELLKRFSRSEVKSHRIHSKAKYLHFSSWRIPVNLQLAVCCPCGCVLVDSLASRLICLF